MKCAECGKVVYETDMDILPMDDVQEYIEITVGCDNCATERTIRIDSTGNSN